MKKIIVLIFMMGSLNLFAQLSKGDVELFQKYFGVEKAAMVKEYMGLTPAQDSAFWPLYNKYEAARLELANQRIGLIDEYLKSVKELNGENATALVKKTNNLEISFKKNQGKYFGQFSKKIGAVKAAQFYQFENYLHNLTNMLVQENIPFVGEIQQKYGSKATKK